MFFLDVKKIQMALLSEEQDRTSELESLNL
jgi:hypothetical protein